MSPLPIAKHERFAQEIVAGAAHHVAYQRAGYRVTTPNAAMASASRLLRNVKVSERIAELQAEISAGRVASAQEVLEALTQIGRANMQDFMKVGASGEPVLNWAGLSRDHAAALQELTVEEFIDGRSDKRAVRRTRFKLAPKINALELLGKYHRLFTEHHEHRHQHTVLHEILREIDEERRELASTNGGGPTPGEGVH